MKLRKLRKAKARLEDRIEDWRQITDGKRSDISKKHPNGFKKPGRMK